MAGRVYILTEWPQIKMTSEVLFQHKEKRCPQNRNDTFKQILKAWITLQKKIATDRHLFFLLSNSVFQQRHFSNTLSKNAGVISPLLFFSPTLPSTPTPTSPPPHILKSPSVFQCLPKSFTLWESQTCMFVQTGNGWKFTCFIGTTANNQSWNEKRILWKDHFDQ